MAKCVSTSIHDLSLYFKGRPHAAATDLGTADQIETLGSYVNSAWPQEYSVAMSPARRLIPLTAVVGFVAFYIFLICLITHSQIVALKNSIIHFFQNAGAKSIALTAGIVAGIPLVLAAGTAIVFYRVLTKKDPLLGENAAKPKLCGSSQYQVVLIGFHNGREYRVLPCYLDKSTLNEDGTGKAYLYGIKNLSGHYSVSSVVCTLSPIYLCGAELGHLIMLPCYPSKILNIISKILWSPFYAIAYGLAAGYSLIEPMPGRILAKNIEKDWNGGATRAECFWIAAGAQELVWLEAANRPPSLTLAGCWHEWGVVTIENEEGHNVATGQSLTKATIEMRNLVDENGDLLSYGYDFDIFFSADDIKNKITELRQQGLLEAAEEVA